MTGNLFDNAKFGDMFLTTENKQAVFLRFAENAEYEFAILYVEGWGNVQVFRHNGKEIYNDAAHSIVSKQEEPESEELVKVDVPQEDTEEWLYNNIMINAPDVLNPLYQCFFIKEKATDKRWIYSRRRTDVNSEWGEWKKYLYDYE